MTEYVWAMTGKGRHAHALANVNDVSALCGITPLWGDEWRVVDDYSVEYHGQLDELEAPSCGRCARVLRRVEREASQ